MVHGQDVLVSAPCEPLCSVRNELAYLWDVLLSIESYLLVNELTRKYGLYLECLTNIKSLIFISQ